jgi:hypothetical protein
MNLCTDHKVCSLAHKKGGRIKLSGIYRTFIGRKEKQQIWIVDGQRVCLDLYAEFIMGGNDQRYRFNPPGDIWIDNRIGVEELRYTIEHELIERRFMRERGWSYDRAHDAGLVLEREMRLQDKARAEKKGPFYRAFFGRRGGLNVWIVDGVAVRLNLNPDFCFGSHDRRSDFVPTGEVWLDSAMAVEEAYFTLRHQVQERKLRMQGLDLGRAYVRAQLAVFGERVSQEERAARHEAALPYVAYGARERGVKPK